MRRKKEKISVDRELGSLTDDEMFESLDDHLEEDEEILDGDDSSVEDDPWESQMKERRKRLQENKYSIWS